MNINENECPHKVCCICFQVYENGSYDDGQTVFLNLKDAFKGHEDNTEKAMARVSIVQ